METLIALNFSLPWRTTPAWPSSVYWPRLAGRYAKETCPVFPRTVKRIHVRIHGTHGEPLDSFIAVRDDIRARLVPAVREALGL